MGAIGTLAASLSSGALAWVFLVQAPLLSRRLGRDRFVPLQMSLVKPLVGLTVATSAVMLATRGDERHLLFAGLSLGLSLAFLAVAPRALKAGAQSLKEGLSADDKHSAGRFVADGGGKASRVWHRVLGATVLALLASQVAWLLTPVGG